MRVYQTFCDSHARLADSRQPTGDSREPRAERRRPHSREATAERRQPRGDSREATAERRQPRGDSREATADSRVARRQKPRGQRPESGRPAPRVQSRRSRASGECLWSLHQPSRSIGLWALVHARGAAELFGWHSVRLDPDQPARGLSADPERDRSRRPRLTRAAPPPDELAAPHAAAPAPGNDHRAAQPLLGHRLSLERRLPPSCRAPLPSGRTRSPLPGRAGPRARLPGHVPEQATRHPARRATARSPVARRPGDRPMRPLAALHVPATPRRAPGPAPPQPGPVPPPRARPCMRPASFPRRLPAPDPTPRSHRAPAGPFSRGRRRPYGARSAPHSDAPADAPYADLHRSSQRGSRHLDGRRPRFGSGQVCTFANKSGQSGHYPCPAPCSLLHVGA